MAFMMNGRLAAILLVVIPLLSLAIGLILKTAFPRFEAMQKKLDRLNSGIQESLTNVRVVKSFVREDFEIGKFSGLNQDLRDSGMRALKIVIATMPVMMFAMNVTTLAVVWYGGKHDHRRLHACGRPDGLYHLHRPDPHVPDDAFHGIFTELQGQGVLKEDHRGTGYGGGS